MDTGMVFAIIFALILVGFVLAFGVGQIQSFFCLGSNAQTNKAVQDIESYVEEVSVLARGSARTYTISLPSDSKICFVNKNNPSVEPGWPRPELYWNPPQIILENFLQNPQSPSYQSNLWIYSCGRELGEGYKISFLSPTKSFCAGSGQKVYIENKGLSVDISPA